MLLSCKPPPVWLHPSGSALFLAGHKILVEVPPTFSSPEKLHPVFICILHQDYAADLNRDKLNSCTHRRHPHVVEAQATALP